MRYRRRAERWQDEAEKIGQRPVDELQLDDQDDELVPSLTPAKCYGARNSGVVDARVSTIHLRSRQRRTRQVHEIAPRARRPARSFRMRSAPVIAFTPIGGRRLISPQGSPGVLCS